MLTRWITKPLAWRLKLNFRATTITERFEDKRTTSRVKLIVGVDTVVARLAFYRVSKISSRFCYQVTRTRYYDASVAGASAESVRSDKLANRAEFAYVKYQYTLSTKNKWTG